MRIGSVPSRDDWINGPKSMMTLTIGLTLNIRIIGVNWIKQHKIMLVRRLENMQLQVLNGNLIGRNGSDIKSR